ncbi:hypothetical protein H4582DRAFT_1116944 [Lactarius indigo]|nr:hypothetical protein H4582DRAFT_1116944 [Lactarius indigo]
MQRHRLHLHRCCVLSLCLRSCSADGLHSHFDRGLSLSPLFSICSMHHLLFLCPLFLHRWDNHADRKNGVCNMALLTSIGDSPPLRPRQVAQRARSARERADRVCINIFTVIYAFLPTAPRSQGASGIGASPHTSLVLLLGPAFHLLNPGHFLIPSAHPPPPPSFLNFSLYLLISLSPILESSSPSTANIAA